jgi:hypothetical protein
MLCALHRYLPLIRLKTTSVFLVRLNILRSCTFGWAEYSVPAFDKNGSHGPSCGRAEYFDKVVAMVLPFGKAEYSVTAFDRVKALALFLVGLNILSQPLTKW